MDFALIKGTSAWGKAGIAVRLMDELPATFYEGDFYDQSSATLIPKYPAYLPAIWAFCSSPEFNREVRKIDQALKVTNATLVKVPFHLERWQQVAEEKYPDGLPGNCPIDGG
jgi:alkanesulfonate monooxygenase SsuD/methylene tetrahydromethanopterin reductase-like flavin-dependent oxidoreductase (luciferase family)